MIGVRNRKRKAEESVDGREGSLPRKKTRANLSEEGEELVRVPRVDLEDISSVLMDIRDCQDVMRRFFIREDARRAEEMEIRRQELGLFKSIVSALQSVIRGQHDISADLGELLSKREGSDESGEEDSGSEEGKNTERALRKSMEEMEDTMDAE